MRISVGAFIPAAPFQAIASRASRRSPAGSGPTHRQTLPLGGCMRQPDKHGYINILFGFGTANFGLTDFLSDGVDGELPGVVIDSEADIAEVGADVVDPVRDDLAQLLVLEIVSV